MQSLTPAGEDAVNDLSQRYGVSTDAVRALLFAVSAGGGSMAQFYHPDLGGGGQWMRGGMTMVGDMFNSGLQATVSGLCSELSALLSSQQVFAPLPQQPSQNSGYGFMSSGNDWWPSDLGSPSSSGGQNDSRYAYFPRSRRLAISRNGQVTIYDTLDHDIGGVQQQQGGPSGSLSFSSQFGTFTVDSLPMSTPQPGPDRQSQPRYQAPYVPEPQQPEYSQQPQYSQQSQYAPQPSGRSPQSHDEILSALERLGNLHQKGVLSDEEFRAKKSELLARL
jgi:hypothetical protein